MTARSIKFLLVDDLDANLVALEGLLARDGLELLKARSGSEALELLLVHEVALAFLDVQMPGMSGFELAEIMRSAERTRSVPIVFLTAGTVDRERRIRGYETGAVDFLPKPIDPANLLNKAATFYELARQRQELRDSEARLRDANDQLARRNADLAEADRNKDQFLAVLAHELRNPLAPILMGLEMMGSTPGLPAAVDGLAKMMRRQMGQMVHLIDDLLDISRINTGKISLVRSRVDLGEILEAAVEAARPFIDGRDHELIVRKSEIPLALDADRHRLSQVISNLLSNAAKYTPPHGRIEVSIARAAGDMAEIAVKDNGEGLGPDARERIFEMFEQIDPSRQNGLGIGLTLVKNLVELHGGTISVRSDGPGQGSEFTVLLPLAVTVTSAAAIPASQSATAPHKSSRVMVVEDGKSTAGILEMFLRLEGMETRVAYDGEEAVQHARDFRPHLIFMDLGLPKKDGFEAACEIRAEHPDTILIALSGWDRDEDRQRSAAAGFNAHAAKPVTPDGLREFLRLLDQA